MHIDRLYTIFISGFPLFFNMVNGYSCSLDYQVEIHKSLLTQHTQILFRHYNRGIACEHTLPRPFPCPSAPHPSRVRLKASSSPPAIAFQNTAILQCIHLPKPPCEQSPKSLGGLQTPSYPEVSVVGPGAERSEQCVKRWCVLAHCPGVQRANMSWSVRVIDPQEGVLHGCVVVTKGIFAKMQVGERRGESGQQANRGKRQECIEWRATKKMSVRGYNLLL